MEIERLEAVATSEKLGGGQLFDLSKRTQLLGINFDPDDEFVGVRWEHDGIEDGRYWHKNFIIQAILTYFENSMTAKDKKYFKEIYDEIQSLTPPEAV